MVIIATVSTEPPDRFGARTARDQSSAVQSSPSLFLETDATILPVPVALPLILLLSHNTITS